MKRLLLWSTVLLGAAVVTIPVGASAPPGRYTVKTDTVYDSRTGLIWERNVSRAPSATGCTGSVCNLSGASDYCRTLSLGGYTGWRLPAIPELLSIVDPTTSSPAIDKEVFPSTPSEAFWSSSYYAPDVANRHWTANFAGGTSAAALRTSTYWVRCVR